MVYCYIDPGTGSMLFTILIGVLGAAIYALKNLWVKLRFSLSGGKAGGKSANKEKARLAIFTDSKRYWNVFEPIAEELERRGIDALYMTASPDDPALSREFEHVKCEFIGEGNRAFARLNMMRADVLLSSTPGLDVYQWKRSRDVKFYAHIPHSANDIVRYRMFGLDYFDAVLVSGEYQIDQIRELERLRSLPAKDLLVVGSPYLDALQSQLASAPPMPEHPKTVLVAPSWGPSAILSRFGEKIIEALLATDYHIVVRPHPQSFESETALLERLQRAFPDSDRLEWNHDNDNFEVLRRSDILISDFSGVIFDFSLVFDKPIVYADTSFDSAPYDAAWLEEELWTFKTLPRIGHQLTEEDLPEIGAMLDRCLASATLKDAREQARQETWQFPGEGARITVDYLERKLAELGGNSGDAGDAGDTADAEDASGTRDILPGQQD